MEVWFQDQDHKDDKFETKKASFDNIDIPPTWVVTVDRLEDAAVNNQDASLEMRSKPNEMVDQHKVNQTNPKWYSPEPDAATVNCHDLEEAAVNVKDRFVLKKVKGSGNDNPNELHEEVLSGTRINRGVRREPLLDRHSHRMVGGENFVWKLCPGSWTRVVRG